MSASHRRLGVVLWKIERERARLDALREEHAGPLHLLEDEAERLIAAICAAPSPAAPCAYPGRAA